METISTLSRAETHQLEGFDTRNRSFNRNVFIDKGVKGYTSRFSYENFNAVTEPFSTPREAMRALISILEKKGYTRLRSRLNFRGKKYLTETELWIDY